MHNFKNTNNKNSNSLYPACQINEKHLENTSKTTLLLVLIQALLVLVATSILSYLYG